MSFQLGYGEDLGKEEFQMVSVIHDHPLGRDSDDGETLCRLLDSPVHSENGSGSYSPLREIFMIHGSTTESGLKRQRLEEEAHLIQEKER